MSPRVKSVQTTNDYSLVLQFTDDSQGVYDCKPLLDFGVFTELRDLQYFKCAEVIHGTVVWPHEQDICPDTLYLDSVKRANAS